MASCDGDVKFATRSRGDSSDMRDENRIDMHAPVRERTVGPYQLEQREVGSPQTERINRIDVAADTELMDEVGHSLRLPAPAS